MTARRYTCMYQGCYREATCMPRLYVPASKLSANLNVEDCSIMLGLHLCETCFSKLTAKELLQGERGAGLRKAIEGHFLRQRAMPNYDKAVIGRVSGRDHDYHRISQMEERKRGN